VKAFYKIWKLQAMEEERWNQKSGYAGR